MSSTKKSFPLYLGDHIADTIEKYSHTPNKNPIYRIDFLEIKVVNGSVKDEYFSVDAKAIPLSKKDMEVKLKFDEWKKNKDEYKNKDWLDAIAYDNCGGFKDELKYPYISKLKQGILHPKLLRTLYSEFKQQEQQQEEDDHNIYYFNKNTKNGIVFINMERLVIKK